MNEIFLQDPVLNVVQCLNQTQVQAINQAMIHQGRTLGIICLVIGFIIGVIAGYTLGHRRGEEEVLEDPLN